MLKSNLRALPGFVSWTKPWNASLVFVQLANAELTCPLKGPAMVMSTENVPFVEPEDEWDEDLLVVLPPQVGPHAAAIATVAAITRILFTAGQHKGRQAKSVRESWQIGGHGGIPGARGLTRPCRRQGSARRAGSRDSFDHTDHSDAAPSRAS